MTGGDYIHHHHQQMRHHHQQQQQQMQQQEQSIMNHFDDSEYPESVATPSSHPEDDSSMLVDSRDVMTPPYRFVSAVHQCHICHKTFAALKGLQQHYVIHTDERPFRCDICSHTFRFKSNLFEHQSVHTGSLPYACPYCQKTCRLKGNLKKHLRTHVTTKEELEAAWRPFAKLEPAHRRKSAPFPSTSSGSGGAITSNVGGGGRRGGRRPVLANITDENDDSMSMIRRDEFVIGDTVNYRRLHSRKKRIGVDINEWMELIKSGKILPQVNLEDKVRRFEMNIMSEVQSYHGIDDLVEIAKAIAFETHSCPVCKASFMNRSDCDGHCQMEHVNMRTAGDFFCDKCYRSFNNQAELDQHNNYHAMVNEHIMDGTVAPAPDSSSFITFENDDLIDIADDVTTTPIKQEILMYHQPGTSSDFF